LFQVVTAPPLLAGQIAQSRQVTARLRKDLAQLSDGGDTGDINQQSSGHQQSGDLEQVTDDGEGGASLTSAGLYGQHTSDQKAFDRLTLKTAITATRRALAALKPFENQDRTGTLAAYRADLTRSQADFQHLLAQGATPPGSLQPPGGAFGEASLPCATRACSPVL
jgi:hypothetical protein